MSETKTPPVTPAEVTEENLTAAIRSIIGDAAFQALSENSGFTAAHDRACMVAFMENREGRDVEVLRAARLFISQKGEYPYYNKAIMAGRR